MKRPMRDVPWLDHALTFGLLLTCVCVLFAHPAPAASPRVLPEGQLPKDRRLEPLKDLNGYFPMQVPDSRDAWNHRAEELRRRVLV